MTEKRTAAAAIQMVSTANVDKNLQAAQRLVKQAASAGAALVLLPENFAVLDGGPLPQFAEIEGDPAAPLQNCLRTLARECGIYLMAGTIPLLSRPRAKDDSVAKNGAADVLADGRVRPACLLYDPQGSLIARYDKMHLFDVDVDDKQASYRESKSFEAGDEVVVVDTTVARIGMSICYDLRFPELYRRMLGMQAEVLTVPSAFTQVTGAAHWEVLLRARAIENQCYVLAANQGGVHNATRETFGHSMIVNPWGEILDCVEKGEGFALADMDLASLHSLRQKMPVSRHRRL